MDPGAEFGHSQDVPCHLGFHRSWPAVGVRGGRIDRGHLHRRL